MLSGLLHHFYPKRYYCKEARLQVLLLISVHIHAKRQKCDSTELNSRKRKWGKEGRKKIKLFILYPSLIITFLD